MLSMIDMVIVLGQRNVPFRGHGWSKELRREDGNFDFFLHWKSQFDPLLSDHLQFAKKNASYLSPVIQNELIVLAGLEVKESILKDVRSAGWFSVMADECTDVATLEQMSMCIRFVDESTPDQPQVREEFVGFVQLDRTSAAFISEAILQFLKDCNLNISNLRGQGYDGASVMAGKVSGVSTRILEAQPRAMYHHCRGHNLNLVISSSCNQVPEIRNLFDSVRTISWFLGASGKRKFILRKYLKPEDISSLVTGDDSLPEDEQELSDQLIRGAVGKQVPKLCETRWSARVATLSSVMAKYKAMYLALNDIAIESSNTEARTNALSYIRLLQSPTFIISVVVTQCVLSYSHPLCLALQKTDCDIVKAYRNAKLCQTTISAQRNEIKFSELWNKAEAIAAEVGTELTKPRTCHTSRYRSNAGVDTQDTDNTETYYRRNVYYPFIDHCVTEFSQRFPDSSESMFIGYKLLPNKVSSITTEAVEAIVDFYGPDMTNEVNFLAEMEMWKAHSSQLPQAKNEKITLLDALKFADRDFFPNVHSIFKLILTLPVGSVPCERSFSAMRRLKDWSRSTMTENRLSGLALLFIHRDMTVSRENILKRFDSTGHRRIGRLSL